MRLSLSTVCAALLLTGNLTTGAVAGDFQVIEDEALKKIAHDIRMKFKLPGINIAQVYGNRSVRVASAGIRKVGDPTPMTTDDKCHLGSCTKAMTATMIACVIRETNLEWSSTIGDILPEIAKKAHEDYRSVTLRQLVNHTSGLPENSRHMFGMSDKVSPTRNRRILFTKILAETPKSRPGEKYAYSNLGFMLAGLMAETAADSTWRELMQKYLFRPLNMKSAGFGWPGEKGKVDQPWGHTTVFGLAKPVQHDNPEVLGPAGRVHCTVADWARFASLHLGHFPKDMPLQRDDLKTMITEPESGNYSAGWLLFDRPWAKGRALMHNGSNTMWYSVVWVAPKLDQAFLVATNTGKSDAFQACDAAVSAMIVLNQAESTEKNTD